MDDASRDTLISIFQNRNEHRFVRKLCVEALRRIADDASRNALISNLQNPDEEPHFRSKSATALREIGGDASRNALISILQNPEEEPHFRRECAFQLSWIRGDASRKRLSKPPRICPRTRSFGKHAAKPWVLKRTDLGHVNDSSPIPLCADLRREPEERPYRTLLCPHVQTVDDPPPIP